MFKHKSGIYPSVLSVYPVHSGLAFVLFEAPNTPHDWGVKQIKRDITGANTVLAVEEMMQRYRPEVLVLDDPRDHHASTRSIKVTRINNALARLAGRLGSGVAVVSRRTVRIAFARYGALNKHDIAKVIAEHFDAFATRMPRKRKAWETEDRRMSIFDAASRGIAYYYEREQASS